jgi:hypothetical protein
MQLKPGFCNILVSPSALTTAIDDSLMLVWSNDQAFSSIILPIRAAKAHLRFILVLFQELCEIMIANILVFCHHKKLDVFDERKPSFENNRINFSVQILL